MRTYVKPDMKVINLRVEERISGSVCKMVGTCADADGRVIYSNII